MPLNHGGQLSGFILAAPPRAPFKLDREVYDLLRIVGRQVASYVAEQRAMEVLLQARQLHEYGKRFAFVAHDIKNVSSQLSLLLSNAETYLDNPDFQRDMLATIRASVQKIGALIKRLQAPGDEMSQAVILLGERLEAIAANAQRLRGVTVELSQDGRDARVAMAAAAFDAVVTHLLNNAIEATLSASKPGEDPPPRPDRAPARGAARGGRHHRQRPRHEPGVRARRAVPPVPHLQAGWQRHRRVPGAGVVARSRRRPAGDQPPQAGTTMRLLLPLVEAANRQTAGTPDRGRAGSARMTERANNRN